MEIYVALRDSDVTDGPQSYLVGAFSREDLAQDACQGDENETAEGWGRPAVGLLWKNAEAESPTGLYSIILVDLDVAQ